MIWWKSKKSVLKVLRPFQKFLKDNNYDADRPVFMQGTFDFQ